MRRVGLIGVPSSAAAHWPGQEKAPLALRTAGLVARLQVAGVLRSTDDLALLYFDGGVDLYTPATNPDGILDSMGVAHLLGEPGAAEELSRLGPRHPLLTEDHIVYFGQDQGRPDDPESAVLARRSIYRYPAARVRGRPRAAAAEALGHLERLAGRFLMHFDVDAIDFVDFPGADVPQFNTGLTFAEAMESLAVFAASPRLGGLVVTEFNPDHADEEGALAAALAQGIADAMALDAADAAPR